MKKIEMKLSLIVLIMVILLISLSYAYLQMIKIGVKNTDVVAGTLSLNLDEKDNGLNIAAAYPMTSEDGKNSVPYTFTLENNGTIDSDYTIYLDDLDIGVNKERLENNIIRYYLTRDEDIKEEDLLTGLGTSPKRILDRGVIKAGSKQNYTIRLWLDERVGHEASGKVFKGKLRIEASQVMNTSPEEVTGNVVLNIETNKNHKILKEYNDETYEILDDTVITVDENGLITAKKLGVTEVIIRSKRGNYKKTIKVTVEKEINVEYIKQGIGVESISRKSDSCKINEEGTSCEVELPGIVGKAEYKVLGWNEDKNATTGELPNSKVNINKNTTYYSISKKDAIVYTVNFNANGNIIKEEQKSCTIPEVFNNNPQETSCNITTPVINAPANTPIVVGYNTSKTATSSALNSNTSLTVTSNNSGSTYYAITRKDAVKRTATYVKGSGVSAIGATSNSCTIAATYNGVLQVPSCTVTLPTITVASGYTGPFFNTSSTAATGNTASTSISLSSNVTYYAKAAKSVSTLTISLATTTYVYDGAAKKPAITVKDGATVLRLNTDYSVAYSNNVNAGTATVTVTGKKVYNGTTKNLYSGTKTINFSITKATMQHVVNSYSGFYDGKAHTIFVHINKPTSGYTIRYGTSAGTYNLTSAPTYTTAGGRTVYFQITHSNFNTVRGSGSVSISEASIQYSAHVQSKGWMAYVSNGATGGTTGQNLRMEAIKIRIGAGTNYSAGVSYSPHVQTYGWKPAVSNDAIAGTIGEAKRMEAIKINLTGSIANYYDIYYRAHCQSVGWLDWAKNGNIAGTTGYAYAMQAIEIRLVHKGGAAPGPTAKPYMFTDSYKLSISSSRSAGNWQTCIGYWYENKYQFNITATTYGVASGKMCFSENGSSVSSNCANYPTNRNTGAGDACFNSSTNWSFYRSIYCAYAYVCNSAGKCTSKFQC